LYDTRDDPIDPRRGHFLGADLQLSLSLLGGDRFAKSYVQGATYLPLGTRALLALNARLGLSATYGRASPEGLPLPDRFFAGGDFSVRGFPTDFLGPLAPTPSGSLVPTGGNALLLGSAELRVDCARALALAAFADTGNVFLSVSDLDVGKLRLTAGLGLRYKSALGPLRLDYGWKLDRRTGESPGHLHVTIGHAF
jgi:outer membrane protein insertion porin family